MFFMATGFHGRHVMTFYFPNHLLLSQIKIPLHIQPPLGLCCLILTFCGWGGDDYSLRNLFIDEDLLLVLNCTTDFQSVLA